MNNELMFSSTNQAWATPIDLFNRLHDEFVFTLDPCASHETAKCNNYFTEDQDGLKQDWGGHCAFVNPPYNQLYKWVKKSFEESRKANTTVVMLIPARTDTRAFHQFIHRKAEVRFIKGRLIFGTDEYWQWVWEQETINGKKNSLYKKHGKKNSAPFPSMIVIF